MLRILPGLVALVLTVYAVVDCIQTEQQQVRNLPKPVWILIILLFPVAGPIAWFVVGRPTLPPLPFGLGRPRGPGSPGSPGNRGPGNRGPGGGPRPPRGPDDDPDFLRKL